MANPPAAAVYDTPTRCTGGPAPGAVAFMARVLELFPGTSSAGIYDCRPTRTGKSLSEHAEGRATDVHVSSKSVGDRVAAWATRWAPQLGIQTIIWNDRQWTSTNPAWRPYVDRDTGRPFTDPTLGHRDHVHIGLTRAAGGSLTAAALGGISAEGGSVLQGFAGSVGSTVTGFGGDLVESAVAPFVDGLRRLTITGLALSAGAVLVVLGGYRTVTGRSLTRDATKAAAAGAELYATGGTSAATKTPRSAP